MHSDLWAGVLPWGEHETEAVFFITHQTFSDLVAKVQTEIESLQARPAAARVTTDNSLLDEATERSFCQRGKIDSPAERGTPKGNAKRGSAILIARVDGFPRTWTKNAAVGFPEWLWMTLPVIAGADLPEPKVYRSRPSRDRQSTRPTACRGKDDMGYGRHANNAPCLCGLEDSF